MIDLFSIFESIEDVAEFPPIDEVVVGLKKMKRLRDWYLRILCHPTVVCKSRRPSLNYHQRTEAFDFLRGRKP